MRVKQTEGQVIYKHSVHRDDGDWGGRKRTAPSGSCNTKGAK